MTEYHTVLIEALHENKQEKEDFKSKGLGLKWATKYPNLFDNDDIRLYKSQSKYGYHYFEWKAAIHFWEEIGYQSLNQKYQTKQHAHKKRLIESNKYISEKNWKEILPLPGMLPDLFVYSKETEDWFFCEVKSPNDGLHDNQNTSFPQISRYTKKPIGLITFGKKRISKDTRLVESKVNTSFNHFEIYSNDKNNENSQGFLVGKVSQIIPGSKYCFSYEFDEMNNIPEKEVMEAKKQMNRELNLFFIEERPLPAWEYAKYHCSTASNLYSNIRWTYLKTTN
jgi:hypothetical protein